MRFIDLFCGIGGFHSALSNLGHECVFACDNDVHAAAMYEINFGISAHSDIRECIDLPDFDILCAGFPCQPFSKSGSQSGFKDEIRGTLFHEIMRIVKGSQPKILFLENVPNLESHDGGNTYEIIKKNIENEGYKFWSQVLSPHKFGTPQIRKRLFMVAIKIDICGNEDFVFPKETNERTDVNDILEDRENVEKKYFLSKGEIEILESWNYFIKNIPEKITPASPTWSQDFGRSYPLEEIHPISNQKLISKNKLSVILTHEGISPLHYRSDIISQFPPYISQSETELPEWKKKFITNNRDLWGKISIDIGDEWVKKVREFKNTFQKFEWQVGKGERDIWKHIIQTRPSGIRVKKSNYIPALVAIAQIPIIGWQKRKMSPKECARAQNFDVDGLKGKPYVLSTSDSIAYKQLGNSVDVKIIRLIMSKIEKFIR
ncbi:DNA cytosine methyltransferase [Euryarchaeota archaeon]|nr:DNA cytosine methyltransferase [Euryarchaeota archaeon]